MRSNEWSIVVSDVTATVTVVVALWLAATGATELIRARRTVLVAASHKASKVIPTKQGKHVEHGGGVSKSIVRFSMAAKVQQ